MVENKGPLMAEYRGKKIDMLVITTKVREYKIPLRLNKSTSITMPFTQRRYNGLKALQSRLEALYRGLLEAVSGDIENLLDKGKMPLLPSGK
jgi:hypothetical protein